MDKALEQKNQGLEPDRAARPAEGQESPAASAHLQPRASIDPAKMTLLLNAAKALASTTDLDQLLNVIGSEVRTVLECEGTGVVLYDEERDDFYWRSVQDRESLLASAREEIRIPKDQGVGGWVFRTGHPALIHDAAGDPRIYRKVEDKSGFLTRNMICVPLKTMEKALGVLYALNKIGGSFTEEDVEILMALSTNIALALETAAQYEKLVASYNELERLNRVKNRILNHLSHELKTPLAIIEASLHNTERRIRAEGLDSSRFPFERIFRNLERLKSIERQVGYIVERKGFRERELVARFLDHLKDLIEIEKEDEPWLADALDAIRRKIEELFPSEFEEEAGVSARAAFQAAEFRVRRMTQGRTLTIEFPPPDPAIIKLQPQIMMSVMDGLIRNSVENTPDHGKIVVKGKRDPNGYRISIRDYGVGIPESEQPNIFEGFYPVQEPDLYTSGRRYGFNAGGTGTDLLKIKIFSERFGFNIRFESHRCSCIPTTRDLCPGDITKCPCCQRIEDCYENGGTEFVVEFPPELVLPEEPQ
ncbi:MAG: GAF domain-containing protein [Deltaproteobacteria bacterium]|nr:GAF domain-containing protein [Deltaproteobacteria bacterium]